MFLSALSFAPRAVAGPYALAPGGSITAASSTFPIGGTTVASKSESFLSASLNGTVVSSVISGDTSNPFGGLTFTYLVTLNSASPDDLSELSVGSYGGFLTDVSYNNSTGGGVAPNIFSRSLVLGGNALQFSWTAAGLPPDETGALIVVQTSASNYGITFGGVIDDFPVTLDNLYAPSAVVPEVTGTAGLLAAGLGMVFILARRFGRRELAGVTV
jgi:hypothetical protein